MSTHRGIDGDVYPILNVPEEAKVTMPTNPGQIHKGWQYRCPRGHTTIRRNKVNTGRGQNYSSELNDETPFYCNTCRLAEREPEHEYVVDMTKVNISMRDDDRYHPERYSGAAQPFGFSWVED